MLLEGGIFVKTWTSKVTNQKPTFLEGKVVLLPAMAFGSLWLDELGEQALQTLRSRPADKTVCGEQETLQEEQFLPRVSGSQ